ncbi:MAG TPA: lipopolysaccharide kinase InaA family protein, partial [Planctomycetaceae bacterium]|nr:lipopolysaccharide kinase InaA family protein [Planctomycetaceae bacterium]
MTPPNPPVQSVNDPLLSIPSFEDLALHLSHEPPPTPTTRRLGQTDEALLPVHLDPSATPSPNDAVLKRQPVRPDIERFCEFAPSEFLPHREPLHSHERFSSDPRDDVRLKWADESMPWWHFDVEARMVDRETLWIMEKLEEVITKYLRPVWWDRFVEGVHDFFGMIYHELIRPVWSVFIAPLAALLPDIDWPWNFELRGAHVSVKQSPFRRIVFDNRAPQELIERLWADPSGFIDAGLAIKKDDRTTVARVPLRQPGITGDFPTTSTGVMKRFNLRDWGHTLSHLLWFTRASRSWVYGREMLDAGIGTARPLAMIEDRLGPFRFRSFVVTEHIEGTRLDSFLQQTRLSTTELDRLAAQFAHIWHTLGEMRIGHGDMKAANFMVTPNRQLKIIDLDGTWRHWFDVTFLPRRDRD